MVTGAADRRRQEDRRQLHDHHRQRRSRSRQANPKSTADLLKISPGLWPESTGGQTGANIEIAGFPGGGDAPLLHASADGLAAVRHADPVVLRARPRLFRLDDTIERVEILQGGPSVVFADGQIGATANFILKHGTETPVRQRSASPTATKACGASTGSPASRSPRTGTAASAVSTRDSDGVRDPQFTADDGGQLTATLIARYRQRQR